MIGTMAMPDKYNGKQCRDLDGQIFPLSDAKTGRNYPPMHPWCRSLAVAVIDRKFTENMTRRATDPKTGETQEIPYDMTYREWEAWQKAGGPNVEKWRKLQLTEVQKKDIMDRDWSKAEFSNANQRMKYDKHKAEFDNMTFEKYRQRGIDLLSEPVSDQIQAIIRSDGSISRYNYKTNEFAVGTADGKIRTFFKPEDKENYWRDEYERN